MYLPDDTYSAVGKWQRITVFNHQFSTNFEQSCSLKRHSSFRSLLRKIYFIAAGDWIMPWDGSWSIVGKIQSLTGWEPIGRMKLLIKTHQDLYFSFAFACFSPLFSLYLCWMASLIFLLHFYHPLISLMGPRKKKWKTSLDRDKSRQRQMRTTSVLQSLYK